MKYFSSRQLGFFLQIQPGQDLNKLAMPWDCRPNAKTTTLISLKKSDNEIDIYRMVIDFSQV